LVTDFTDKHLRPHSLPRRLAGSHIFPPVVEQRRSPAKRGLMPWILLARREEPAFLCEKPSCLQSVLSRVWRSADAAQPRQSPAALIQSDAQPQDHLSIGPRIGEAAA